MTRTEKSGPGILWARLCGRMGGPMSFVPREMLTRIAELSTEELDALPFGVVGLSDDGRIEVYNRFEANFTKLDREHVVGEPFFERVAPCTATRLVQGRFRKGVETGTMDDVFGYTFSYRMEPVPVQLHLYRCPISQTNWLFVQPLFEQASLNAI